MKDTVAWKNNVSMNMLKWFIKITDTAVATCSSKANTYIPVCGKTIKTVNSCTKVNKYFSTFFVLSND